MTPQEYDLIETLDADVKAAVLSADAELRDVLSESEYDTALMNGSLSCRRTVEQQRALYAKGRRYEGGAWVIVDPLSVVTKCDGIVSKSNHQGGRAVDIGLRLGRTVLWDNRRSQGEAHELFLLVACVMKRRGFLWAADSTDPWFSEDRHHFEMPKGA